ncbi:hypothetical protein MUG94_01760 [Arthrobacter gengyunqii]|uniref:Uncharacterized protein n=1 Tax=Arthrobacter gengyunqii TaxID=2886940 RepID=A0A9X1M4X1_9MICC|nr:hypothetical protein [Arthrobacter gengyunqii]MCC3270965.1 hypothetical protein [Arthrobacter gengyunqii]UOY96544.1 hypothetical protein MUG94_01760 [Arthrobacter gengyunqii]
MEFLVIVLFVVAIVAVNFAISRAQRRKKQAEGDSPASGEGRQESGAKQPRAIRNGASAAKAAPGASRISVEAAREANARLDAIQHQQVYAAIAQGHPIKAVKLYAQFTGVGVRAAGAAVENLAMHPQPFQPPRPAGSAAPSTGGNAPADSPSNPAAAGDSAPAESEPLDNADTPEKTTKPDNADTPDKTTNPDSAASDRGAADKTASPTKASPSEDKPRQGAAAKPPSNPEEDEISQWVKNLRPEDF